MKRFAIITLSMMATFIFSLSIESQGQSPTPDQCTNKADMSKGFKPTAITLKPLNVRSYFPEYSILKGKWVFGRIIHVLQPNTCIAIIEKRMVGVIQIWYLINYQSNADNSIKTGWVWGGTRNVDEDRYIGGDKRTPAEKVHGRCSEGKRQAKSFTFHIIGLAYAQADHIPSPSVIENGNENFNAREGGGVYLVKVPLIGLTINVAKLSAFLLYLTMVLGMAAKTVWDQTDEGSILPPAAKIVKPILISPIAFSAFWGPMYVQQGSAGVSLTTALYAFQIGFMWQHVLERRIGVKGKNDSKTA